jgi:hypothetical protein
LQNQNPNQQDTGAHKDDSQKIRVQSTDWTTRLNRSKAADYFIVILAMLPAFLMYYDRYSPDAAVYFTYFKNFFDRPFSFQADQVAFGATSPLHVMLYAPLHALLGSWWIFFAKLLNFLLVGVGVVALNRALKGGTKSVLLTALLVLLCAGMLVSVSQLFETGLAFLAMAFLYHDLNERKFERALLISGSLYLIRPELIVMSAAVSVYIMMQPGKAKALLPWLLFGFAPVLGYHIYMLAATGTLIPSGVMAPIIALIQEPSSWLSRLSATISALWSAQGLIYLAGGVLMLVMVVEWSAPRYTRELLLIAPLLALYLFVPPGEAIVRYLVPVLPALIAIFVRYITKELKVQHSNRALLVSLALAHVFGIATLSATAQSGRDTVLMSSLSKGINDLTQPGDRVLLYDIQSQYQTDAHCYGLSGEVGSDLNDVLLRRVGVNEFIQKNDVRYLVTSNPLGERALYQNTLLSELHAADPWVELGDTVMVGGLAFEKQFSNPAFVLRNSAAAPAYADAGDNVPFPTQLEADGPDPLWNSVYKVVGDEAAIVAARTEAMALLDGMVDPVEVEDVLFDSLSQGVALTPTEGVSSEALVEDTAAVIMQQPAPSVEGIDEPVPAKPDSSQ